MTKKQEKKTQFGWATLLFIGALFFIIPALRGNSITFWEQHAGGVPLSCGQMIAGGSVLMIMAIISFYRSFVILLSPLPDSKKGQRKK